MLRGFVLLRAAGDERCPPFVHAHRYVCRVVARAVRSAGLLAHVDGSFEMDRISIGLPDFSWMVDSLMARAVSYV